VKARLTMLPNQTRRGQKYRPNHKFGNASNRHFFIGQIDQKEDQWLRPGEAKEVVVEFFNVRGLAEKLIPGVTWRIQEGATHVGNAEVIALVTEP